MVGYSADVDGIVRLVVDDLALEPKEAAEAVADVKDDDALGRRSSGVIVVSRVSHAPLSSVLRLRRRSPRPSTGDGVLVSWR